MKLVKRKEKKKGIQWDTLIACGVKDTTENRIRHRNGEALDLILEADSDVEVKNDPVTNKVDLDYLKEQQQSEDRYLEAYREQESQDA